MGKREKPIDVILALIPSLTKKELEQLKKKLGVKLLSACEEKGHNLKATKSYRPGFFGMGPPITIMVCTRCGKRIAT